MRKIILIAALIFSVSALANKKITYPERAEKLRIDGEVNVLYDVDEKGKAVNIRLVSAEPKYIFDRHVMKHIAGWNHPEGQPQTDIPLKVVFKAN